MAGQQDTRMSCSEFDALLSQAIDGTLSGERLTAFEAHAGQCKLCGPLLQEAEAGRGWLKSLEEVEPPVELVTNILVRTTGPTAARQHLEGRSARTWMDRLSDWTISPVLAAARQPRFAMSFSMAFLTLSVMLSVTGVRLHDLKNVDLRPSAIRRTYYETTGRVVKYYENIRFVYEIESRVRQFKQATAPAQQPPAQQNNNDQKEKNKNDTSGQPEQKQERNYSQEGNQPVFASLPEKRNLRRAELLRVGVAEPPVVSVTTRRRFV